ncbi:MAG: hypothetical protein GX434_15740 [Peptococcaceae bacterium]|nr:hypothetical protein [Peptococcaceae bacterium]
MSGVRIVYDSGIEEAIENLTIDYSDSSMQRGFIVKGSDCSDCSSC